MVAKLPPRTDQGPVPGNPSGKPRQCQAAAWRRSLMLGACRNFEAKMKITFFRSRNEASAELAARLKQALAAGALRGLTVEVRVQEGGTQADMLRACLGDDAVIFDGSVEDDVGSNYAAATAQPMAMDHVLVVSRTHLPLNFYGLREGGSPNSGGTTDGRNELDNEELLPWLLVQIEDLATHPRPPSERILLELDQSMVPLASAITSASEAIMHRSLDLQKERRRRTVFVSYLSKYSRGYKGKTPPVGERVEDLIEQLPKLRGRPDLTTKYWPPGSLSSEFMTEQRRWQVVSIVDRYIRTAEEFLVFESPDYLESWWTQAELVMVGYSRASSGGGEGPRVIRYRPPQLEQRRGVARPASVSFEEADPTYVPLLPEPERREMTRFLSNADPGTSGLESAKAMRAFADLPAPLLWLAFKGGRWTRQRLGLMPPGSVLAKVDELTTFKDFKQSVKSRAYKESFWTDRIVTCRKCRPTGRVPFDAKQFVHSRGPGMYRVHEGDLERALQRGEWSCEKGHRFRVVEDELPHFHWWAVRMGRTTGPGDVHVERVPKYRLEEMQ
jgi:hypothetical protein